MNIMSNYDENLSQRQSPNEKSVHSTVAETIGLWEQFLRRALYALTSQSQNPKNY